MCRSMSSLSSMRGGAGGGGVQGVVVFGLVAVIDSRGVNIVRVGHMLVLVLVFVLESVASFVFFFFFEQHRSIVVCHVAVRFVFITIPAAGFALPRNWARLLLLVLLLVVVVVVVLVLCEMVFKQCWPSILMG